MTHDRAAYEQPSRKQRKAVHLAWAALAIIVSAVLVFVPQTGHPPPMVLVPAVLLAWPVGHVLIWAVGGLADKGRQSAVGTSRSSSRWPAVLLIALIGTGAGSVAGLIQLLGSGLQGRWYPYGTPGLWTGMLLVWFLHAVCLVALLLRRPWARPLTAAFALGWAALLSAQLVEHLGPTSRSGAAELLPAFGLLALLVALAVSVLASPAVKSFLDR